MLTSLKTKQKHFYGGMIETFNNEQWLFQGIQSLKQH